MNKESIAAVVVTYNPGEALQQLIISLAEQVETVFVIDNGSVSFVMSSENDNVRIAKLEQNEGIAEAQNKGIDLAAELNHKYVIFFDQDSIVPQGMISDLFTNFIDIERSGIKLAGVGPIFYDFRFNYYYPQILLNKDGSRQHLSPEGKSLPFEVSFIISSGSLVSMDALSAIGKMKSEYFIDYVDIEWCLRAGHLGYKFYSVPGSKMQHAIGDDNISFLRYKLPVHSPWRRYYRMRNMYYLFKLPYVPFRMKVREFITNSAHQLLLTLSVPGKRLSYLKYWINSQIDGIKILMR